MIIFIISFLKLILSYFFSSEYESELFVPFIKNAILNFPNDPWNLALQEGNVDSFPYHPLMLYVYGIFQVIPVLLGFSDGILRLFLFLPNLLADLLIFYILKCWFPNRKKAILLIYFLSPILLYSVYCHGQLDLFPTSLLFLSLYFLLKHNIFKSGLIFGLAISMKLHIIAALPMFLFYIYRKSNLKFNKFLVPLAISFALISLPWYFSSAFRSIVLTNPKQDLLFATFYKIGEYQLIVPIFATVLIYFKFFSYRKINPDLLITWLAILFSVFVLTIPPAPGWYVWTLPFLVYFYLKFIKRSRHVIYLAGILNLSFLLFFLFSWRGDYLDLLFLGSEFLPKLNDLKLNGILFTGLSVSLVANLYAIYGLGVKSNRIYSKPGGILIGIGGDSGAGKSTLLHSLANLFNHSVTLLEGDGDHRWERGNQNYEKFTHLNPRANYLERQAENLFLLKKGETIYRPDYDHSTGAFTTPQAIQPSDFIILSGLHTFYLPKMRKVIDLKIFIDTDETLRKHWKILRDIEKRGYSKDKILQQIKERQIDSNKFIKPQKDFADFSIEYFPLQEFEMGSVDSSIEVGLKITLLSEFSFESIAVDLEESGFLSEWNYLEDLKRQYFIFNNSIPSDYLDSLVERVLPNMEELVPGFSGWEEGFSGILQFFVLVLVHQHLKDTIDGL